VAILSLNGELAPLLRILWAHTESKAGSRLVIEAKAAQRGKDGGWQLQQLYDN
jgi:hypothetical protein